jgi:Photosynthetic reaction centre cytochrome C subunit
MRSMRRACQSGNSAHERGRKNGTRALVNKVVLSNITALLRIEIGTLHSVEAGREYCHDVTDLSLDTKPQKVKARMMLEMVRDINAKFGDGKTHVTCWTCHRGSTQPQVSRPIPQ